MQKETMSKERVEEELLNKANLEIIDKEIPEFKYFLNDFDISFIYRQGISTKLNYHTYHYQIVWGHLKNFQEREEAKKTLIAYKEKTEKLLDRNISWSDFGHLINEIRDNFDEEHKAELLRRFLELLPTQFHQYITEVEEMEESEAKKLKCRKYFIFYNYEDIDGIADGDCFNVNSLEEGVEQVINYFSE